MCTSTAAPTITSASIVGITTGSITNGTYSLTRNRPLDRLSNGLPISMTSIPNGLINSESRSIRLPRARISFSALSVTLDQSLLNIDPRYAATYGNPYLKQPHSPLITSHTANPGVTPAPPPYSGTRGSNSNSSFSSSTTISNINGGGSIVGIGANLSGSNPSQTPSPSGQFIVPANTKIGALATHV